MTNHTCLNGLSFLPLNSVTLVTFNPRHRAEFLGHMRPCESLSSADTGPASGNWTLVDEGGEEVSRQSDPQA